MDDSKEYIDTYKEYQDLPAYEKAVFMDGEVMNPDNVLKWSGEEPPPEIGTKVNVTINGLGEGVVVGYFSEHGWLGLKVSLLNAPEWLKEQNNNDPTGHVFGAEL
jgi:hypothetical protein